MTRADEVKAKMAAWVARHSQEIERPRPGQIGWNMTVCVNGDVKARKIYRDEWVKLDEQPVHAVK